MILLSQFYKSVFGCKVYKIPLDAKCTCPNRDGTKGNGGCIFCGRDGSGDFIADGGILRQFEEGIKLVEKKARGRSGSIPVKFMPYFQKYTSTYGDVEILRKKFSEVSAHPLAKGFAVATRPDCLPPKIIQILKEIAEKTFLQIELGLQTSNEKTGEAINRCYTDEDYKNAVALIKKEIPKAHIVTHVIFGLPDETEKDMLNTVGFVRDVNHSESGGQFGIKIANLYVLKNTKLGEMFLQKKYVPPEKEEYFSVLKKALALLPENTVVHRLNGDPPKKEALAPQWAFNKKQILTELQTRVLSVC